VSITAIYHLCVSIIGRDSGRSAVGSAAYRAGEKLKAIGAAAYRSGGELGGEIVHDYTRKRGVVYNEIILPDNAPEKYIDRETLWNAVEARERRRDARLARGIEVALQAEFELQEHIELLREYIRENFVEKGMIADFAVHNKGDGNPHAHIMLTTRHVTPDGFGGKNRDWDKDVELIRWRENWADINNRKFEEKGLDVRIDHRTLKAQGIDREPTIHLGHEAWALEKKGVKTEKGDYNREIKRRNAERETRRAEKEQKITEIVTRIENARNTPKNNPDEAEPTDPMAAKHILREIEEYLKVEKADKIVEKLYAKREARREEAEKIAHHMHELKENFVELDKELSTIKQEVSESKQEIPQLTYRAENMDEHAKNIKTLQAHIVQTQAERQKLSFWEGKRKKELEAKIEQTIGNIRLAQHHFKKNFGIDPDQAPIAINRTLEKVREKTDALNKKTAQISTIREQQAATELEYRTQKLLAQLHPNRQQIEQTLEKMNTAPESVRERLRQESVNHRLNAITTETFQKIIEKLPDHQAQILIERKHVEEIQQEQGKARERIITIERER
jgi:hypothetical protein